MDKKQSEGTDNRSIDSRYVPEFSFPRHGMVFSTNAYMIQGTSATSRDMVVEVYRLVDGKRNLLGRSYVSDTYKWQIITSAPWGTITLICKFQGFTDESDPITYTATYETEPVDPPIPVIQRPVSGTVQPLPLYISGTKEFANATVEILFDLGNNTPLGSVDVTGRNWTVKVPVLPAGPVSLVAEQVKNGVRSGRSAAHIYKIPPPTLSRISATRINATTIRFSGTGYFDERLETQVQLRSIGVPVPPPTTVQKNGTWETDAAWPFGMYQIEAVQKISDNANGWIDSAEYRFTINHVLPVPSDVAFTRDYQPTFSGKGLTGARVSLYEADRETLIATDAPVNNDLWTTKAIKVWGPSYQREVHIRQYFGSQAPSQWHVLTVSIPPLAPDWVTVVENAQSPRISGNCWPGAVVILEYNNDGVKHRTTVTGATWTFRRDLPFTPDVTHSFSVTQTFASQTSVPATGSFTVRRAMLKPQISVPAEGADISSNTTISGKNGMSGATMSVWDEQMGDELNSKQLTSDGDWSIGLVNLKYREYSLTARQTLGTAEPARSDIRMCNVVLLPPVLLTPGEGRDLPRHSTLSGTGWPGARVSVWLQGRDEPLLDDVSVDAVGQWGGQVSLNLVGSHRLRLRQTFADQVSKDLLRDVRVVPSTPVIESPIKDAAIGAAVVISGFGYPGDTVTVKLAGSGATLGSGPVLENRTWSLSAHIDHPGGPGALTVEAASGDFVSAVSEPQPVQINTWLPGINAPSAGRWIALPVTFAGTGKAGVGQVVSWFNPDVVWAAELAVSNGQWQGEAAQALSPGGNWCRFRQTFAAGTDPASASDWAESQRFEVLPLPPSR
jgi:hypothetical protein